MQNKSRPFGNYQLSKRIGFGGMAEVYLADHPQYGQCALKILLEDLARDRSILDSFKREANIGISLNHRNLVNVFGYESIEDIHAIAMELIDGPTLFRILCQKDFLSRPNRSSIAFDLASQLNDALDCIHGQDPVIIHRDISPQNIFVDQSGTLKLADFGIAKQSFHTHHTRTGFIRGKLSYISPEQAREELITPATDYYALGLILFEMLTGEPYNNGSNEVARMRFAIEPNKDRIEQALKSPHMMFKTLLQRLLAQHPTMRLSTAQEVRKVLVRIESETPGISTCNWSEVIANVAFNSSDSKTTSPSQWPLRQDSSNQQSEQQDESTRSQSPSSVHVVKEGQNTAEIIYPTSTAAIDRKQLLNNMPNIHPSRIRKNAGVLGLLTGLIGLLGFAFFKYQKPTSQGGLQPTSPLVNQIAPNERMHDSDMPPRDVQQSSATIDSVPQTKREVTDIVLSPNRLPNEQPLKEQVPKERQSTTSVSTSRDKRKTARIEKRRLRLAREAAKKRERRKAVASEQSAKDRPPLKDKSADNGSKGELQTTMRDLTPSVAPQTADAKTVNSISENQPVPQTPVIDRDFCRRKLAKVNRKIERKKMTPAQRAQFDLHAQRALRKLLNKRYTEASADLSILNTKLSKLPDA